MSFLREICTVKQLLIFKYVLRSNTATSACAFLVNKFDSLHTGVKWQQQKCQYSLIHQTVLKCRSTQPYLIHHLPMYRQISDTKNTTSLGESDYDFCSDSEIQSWMSQMQSDFNPDKDSEESTVNAGGSSESTDDSSKSTSDSGNESDIESSESDAELSDRERDESTGRTVTVVHDEINYEEFFNEDDNIIHEELIEEYPLPIDLTRGERGVFEVEELVRVLEEENAMEICVIPIPPEIQYADYLLIATGKSFTHLLSMAELIRWIFKRKRGTNDPKSVRIEGLLSRDWLALDLGNVVVHLMLDATRKKYDLETLWLHGPESDPQCEEFVNPYKLNTHEHQSHEHQSHEHQSHDHQSHDHQSHDHQFYGMQSVTGWHTKPEVKK